MSQVIEASVPTQQADPLNERMPLMGSRISAALSLLQGNRHPYRRQRLFGNRIVWAIATVRAYLDDRRQRHVAPRTTH
jgi:hypothetical protein